MRFLFLIGLTLVFTSPLAAQNAAPKTSGTTKKAATPAASKSAVLSTAELAEKVKPSVVVILHTGRQGKQSGLGTGFVVGDGLIATNFHVIGEGRPISVQTPDGTKHEVEAVHASDRHLDLAVLKIKGNALKPIELGDSESLKDGQPIVVLGHPQGLKFSVVAGVLSGRREIEGLDLLQIALPIEQGNSGGPVLDGQGRVVGVVSMKSLVTANLGFAIPVNTLARVVPQLIQNGRVIRPDIGITRVLETERGLVVVTIAPNGPADHAGLLGFRVVKTQRRRGPFVYEEQRLDRSHADLIVTVDGRRVKSADDLLGIVEAKRPGETVELGIIRDSQEGRVAIVLGAGE